MNHEELYLVRRTLTGTYLAKYTHVEDNVYMDTTCRDHENCLIGVKEENGNIVFDKPENKSAADYVFFHHGKYFPTKESAIENYYKERKKNCEQHINEYKSKIEDNKPNILKKKLKVDHITNIEDINFDDVLYTIKNENIFPLIVIRKVLTKEGIVRIEGHVEDNNNMKFDLCKDKLDIVYIIDNDEEDSDYTINSVFPNKKSAENWIKNTKSDEAVIRQESLEKTLKEYEDDLIVLNYKIENKLFTFNYSLSIK